MRDLRVDRSIVFDRTVSWEENVRIMTWASLQYFKNAKIVVWVVMRCTKRGSTLRFSRKGDKPYPRIVLRFGKQDRRIKLIERSRRSDHR